MIKKFKQSSKCWLKYLTLLFEKQKYMSTQKKSIELEELQKQEKNIIKKVLERALQSLKKKKHIKVLSQYARLEFLYGNSEKGRSTFESIISNFPKRTDIWSVYLDMEVKYGSVQTIRNLFERCISMNLKSKKMKFFFKRYLQYEISENNDERIEYVKNKANEYVESVMN